MHWVLQDKAFTDRGWGELVATLARLGIPHSFHAVKPYVGTLDPDVDPQGNVIVFGSYAMRNLAAEKGWVPGCFDIERHTYADHVARWGAAMLNGDAVYCRFDEVLDRVPDGVDEFFLRPVVDTKTPAGEVTDRRKFGEWLPKVVALGPDAPTLGGSTRMMVCAVKPILREYRVWIVDREVATASLYKSGDRAASSPEVEPGVLAFARDRASEWEPARAYVLDVAVMGDGGMRVIETNSLNAAGLYAADVPRLVEAIERMTF